MKVMLIYLGWTIIIVVTYFSGLFMAPSFIEKIFPKWSSGKQAAIAIRSLDKQQIIESCKEKS